MKAKTLKKLLKNVPDNMEVCIMYHEEYDGRETIHEAHRKWG